MVGGALAAGAVQARGVPAWSWKRQGSKQQGMKFFVGGSAPCMWKVLGGRFGFWTELSGFPQLDLWVGGWGPGGFLVFQRV